MTLMEHLLYANEQYSEAFREGKLPRTPRLQLAILTCMDSRIDPDRILGLQEGDAHVIRNAGGRASDDAIRSLVLSYRLLGTRYFLVIHHTDCGMTKITNDQMRDELLSDLGADVSHIDFLPVHNLESLELLAEHLSNIGEYRPVRRQAPLEFVQQRMTSV